MGTLIFDIETGPLPEAEILQRIPAFGEFVNKPFDPGAVKFGNIKDPEKIRAKLDEARAKHELGREEHEAAKREYERQAVEKAALSAVTGQVVAIGYYETGIKEPVSIYGIGEEGSDGQVLDEWSLLNTFWELFEQSFTRIVGHNIFNFDLPFLIRRSWMLNIEVPVNVLDKGRYWHPIFVDTMTVWSCGSRDYVSLDTLAKLCGHPGKNGEGAEFARLWFGTIEEREMAKRYLENDLEMTYRVSRMLGVV